MASWRYPLSKPGFLLELCTELPPEIPSQLVFGVQDINDSVVAVLIENGAHHVDLMFSNKVSRGGSARCVAVYVRVLTIVASTGLLRRTILTRSRKRGTRSGSTSRGGSLRRQSGIGAEQVASRVPHTCWRLDSAAQHFWVGCGGLPKPDR